MDTDHFLTLALRNPINETIALEIREITLPDARLVADAILRARRTV